MITSKEGLEIVNHLLGARLPRLQESVFRQAWKGLSYKQIAKITNRDVGHIKNVGSALWQVLSEVLNERVTKQNFQSVLYLYWLNHQETGTEVAPDQSERGDRSQEELDRDAIQDLSPPIQNSPGSFSLSRQDWDEAIDISVFVNRDAELLSLTQWVQHDRCRLILLRGMGGIGKTALAVKLAQQFVGDEDAIQVAREQQAIVQSADKRTLRTANSALSGKTSPEYPFEFVIWRSLREAPPIDHLLSDLLKVLSDQQMTTLPDEGSDPITQLLHSLSLSRCLLVLDNLEPLLQVGEGVGQFRKGYEEYAELFRRIAQSAHQSCVVLTSRETPKDISQIAGQTRPVRIMQVSGLQVSGGQAIFAEYGLFNGTEDEWQTLVDHYAGNPLALKIIASRIQDGLDGNLRRFIREYLSDGLAAFADIHDLLDRQFDRLSDAERDVMYWLTVNREAATTSELREDMVSTESKQKLLDSLTSLKQRSLIEKTTHGFTQQPVVMEYVTERLIQRVVREIVEWDAGEPEQIEEPGTDQIEVFSSSSFTPPALPYALPLPPLPTSLLQRYALLKAQCKDYIREVQTRLILGPIVAQLLDHFGSKTALESQLRQILASLRKHAPLQPGYTAGNILNLLCHLQVDLTGYDLSHLTVWQAHLPDVTLSHVNFAYADLSKSVFAESFGSILSVSFNPDGEQLAIVDSNGGLRLWNVQSGQSLMTLRVHDVWTWSVAFSPDGKTLATASDDRTAKLWDATTGECLRILRGHTHTVLATTYSPAGDWLATGSDDLTIRLWNLSGSGSHDRTWVAHDRRVWQLKFSPDGKTLASGSEDHTVKLWDAATGTCLQTLVGHSDWVKGIAFHPDGMLFATGSHDYTIKLWDWRSGQCLKTLTGHSDAVLDVAFSLDGQQLVSASHDQTVRIWDVQSGRCLKVLQGHTNRVWSVAFNADGRRIVSGGDDHAAKLWDLRTGQCIKTFRGYTNAILWSDRNADRSVLASGHEDETIKLWDLQAKRVFRVLRGHGDRVWTVAFSPLTDDASALSQCLLASGSGDQTVKLWNWQTGECLKTLYGHDSWVWSVVFHPSGHRLASSSYDGTIKLWEIPGGDCIRTLRGHEASVVGTIFDTTGERLVSCSFDNTVRIWDVKTGDCINILKGHSNRVWRSVLSADGQRLVSCSYDHTLKLWDLQTGQCLRTFEGHTAPVVSVVLDEARQQIISGSFDQTIKLWNIQTGECIRTLKGHQGVILVLLLDGSLMSGSFDERLKFWDLDTGECAESWNTPQLYESMNILGVRGLTAAQKMTLQALGAIEMSVSPSALVSGSDYRQNGQRVENSSIKYSMKSQ